MCTRLLAGTLQICDELNRLEKVGQFQQLVELSELNPDLKHKVGFAGTRWGQMRGPSAIEVAVGSFPLGHLHRYYSGEAQHDDGHVGVV
eukprot:scaffold29781_cov18-Tisochrysis_lutea.AAC.1